MKMSNVSRGLVLATLAVLVSSHVSGQFKVSLEVDAQAAPLPVYAGQTTSIIYDGKKTTQFLFPGSGTLDYMSPPNVPDLTQATAQIVATNSTWDTHYCLSGTLTSSASATASLDTGTLGAHISGNSLETHTPTCSGVIGSEGLALATASDSLTFYIPGATSSTVTKIGFSYKLDGTYTRSVPCCPQYDPDSDNLTFATQLGTGSFRWGITTLQGSPLATHVDANSGWVSSQVIDNGANGFAFEGVLSLTGANPVIPFNASLLLSDCRDSDCDYTGRVALNLPPGVTFASASRVFLGPQVCNNTLDSAGQVFSASGGNGIINVTAHPGCDWSVSGGPNWVVITSGASGTGNGTVNYQVLPNVEGDQTASLVIAGQNFSVEEQAASISGLAFIGSLAHLAAEENWTTTFTLVNKSSTPATARLSLFGDSGSGPLLLPLAFPQQAPDSGPLLAASLDRTLAANASLIIQTAGSQTPPVRVGSAQLSATSSVDGFAIFHLIPGAQEAVVPMETRKASSYLLMFDNTAGGVLGVAIENASAQSAIIQIVIRDDTGTTITTEPWGVAANGHTSFVLSLSFAATANKRGTIEFDTPAGRQISVLGLRFTPPNNALTTIPALANVGTGGGSFAHLASGGDGWQTTFVLVNTGTSSAPATLKFFNDQTGLPLPLPLAFPQAGGGTTMTVPSYTAQLGAGATLVIVSSGAPQLLTGSAQLSTTGNVSGFVIFRHNNQEAVVPLESRNANAYILAFDNTNGTSTGVAVNAVSAQQANVPVVVRDDTGAQIASDTIALAANGHYAFTLGSDRYPGTKNIRGTIEFDTPAGAQIGALGIRIPAGDAHTYTTLPALAK